MRIFKILWIMIMMLILSNTVMANFSILKTKNSDGTYSVKIDFPNKNISINPRTTTLTIPSTLPMKTPVYVMKYYCNNASDDCTGGISGGGKTRCYTNVNKTKWLTCSSGWVMKNESKT